jgi:hypothetical protein
MTEKNEPKVTVFGEEITTSDKSSRSTGDVVWGMLLILGGSLLLLNFAGALPWEFWDHIWRFWPLLIVLAGLNILLGDNIVSKTVISLVVFLMLIFVVSTALWKLNLPAAEKFPPELTNLIIRWEELTNE